MRRQVVRLAPFGVEEENESESVVYWSGRKKSRLVPSKIRAVASEASEGESCETRFPSESTSERAPVLALPVAVETSALAACKLLGCCYYLVSST